MEWTQRWVVLDATTTKRRIHIYKQEGDSTAMAETTIAIDEVSLLTETASEFELRSLIWSATSYKGTGHCFRSTEALNKWISKLQSPILESKFRFIGFKIL